MCERSTACAQPPDTIQLGRYINVVAHLPGFRPPLSERPFYPNLDAHRLTAADAREAAQRRVTVVTTVSDLLEATERGLRGFTASDSEAFRALIRGNLSVLKAAGVSIAFGTDNYQKTSEAEARTIGALGLFSPWKRCGCGLWSRRR